MGGALSGKAPMVLYIGFFNGETLTEQRSRMED